MQYKLYSLDETRSFAQLIASTCPESASTVYLEGDLGAGKTTLTRFWIQSMGFTGRVKSPTYSLMESYAFDRFNIIHMDLYRLGDPEELEFLGIRELVDDSENIFLIEWPEKGHGFVPIPDLIIHITLLNENAREISLVAVSSAGEQWIEAINEQKNK